MQIRLNLDNQTFTEKPTGGTLGALRVRLCDARRITQITPADLITAIENGQTFTPQVMTGRTADTWQMQQIIIADVDNDKSETDADGRPVKDETGHVNKVPIENPLTGTQAKEICDGAGITPFCMYHTFSNTAALEKFRIVFILDEPITDAAEAVEITKRVAGLLNKHAAGCADTAMADAARYVLGGKRGCVFNNSGTITPLHAMRNLPPAEEPPKPQPTRSAPTASTPTGHRRTLEELYSMRRADIERFDLLAYIERTEHVTAKRSGNTTILNPCPICGHNDDFSITGHLWNCFSASSPDDAGGSIIDYLMHRHGLDKSEAMRKFNQIMGYDVIEWDRAAEAKNSPHSDFNSEKDKSLDDAENVAQTGDLPGRLTPEVAQEILNNADDDFLTLPRFEQFATMAKLARHDTVAIAADTGAGKSSLALNFMYDLLDRYPALYINLEMDEATILQRLVSIHTGMELDRIEGYKRDQQTKAEVDAALTDILSRNDIQLLTDTYNINEIEEQIQRATQGREEPTMVFIDTALLVTTTNKSASRYERFTYISETLRRISRLNNIVMFVLLQQSREGKRDETKRPTNASLKESGSWENDATKIMFLWYNPKTTRKEIIITKNRTGRSGSIELNYSPHTQTYSEARSGFILDDNAPAFDDDDEEEQQVMQRL